MRTVQELAELVAQMRRLQKEYFYGRKSSSLIAARQLEAQVDGAVGAILNDATGLFKEEDR